MKIIELEFKAKINEKMNYPIVYILNNEESVYIGETVNPARRIREHQKNYSKKDFTNVKIIYDEMFNQSATYNIETNLINYFLADEKYIIRNISQTKQKAMHNYYNKEYYDKELFGYIWNELLNKKFVNNSIKEIENKDIFKLSPFKELTYEQEMIKDEIINFSKDKLLNQKKGIYILEGEAGTGKSLLISSLYKELQDLTTNKVKPFNNINNYLIVNNKEMIKSYHKLSKRIPNLKKKNIMRPTTFINKIEGNNKNIVIIDEAHLLLSSPDKFNNFNEENQLNEIINKSDITVIIFDVKQYLKIESFWDEKKLKNIIKESKIEFKEKKLLNQLRIKGNANTINWINDFVSKKINKIPKDKNFDLKIYSDPQKMYEDIKNKNKKEGLSRIVSTFDFEHKKDNKDYYVEAGNLKLPWNSESDDNAWAEKNNINEVGSIYTIQGFDLNYVGVILGPSISYDENKDILKIDISKYKDKKAMMVPENKKNLNINEIKEQIILNSINVLFKRGIKGLYIYACDDKLRNKLLNI